MVTNYTQTKQVRKAVFLEGEEKYEVSIEVLDGGDIPTKGLFVLEINDESDPKEDAFARVATVADLVDINTDRTAAVNAGNTYYRTSSYIFYYDNIDTAASAQEVLKSRIDELVGDWNTYQEQFVTVSETTDHPRTETDTFNALVAAYEDAVVAEGVAETDRDTAKDAYDTASTDASDAITALTTAQTERDTLYELKNKFQAFYDAMKTGSGFYQDAETFRAAAEAYRVATTGTDAVAEGIFETARDTFTGKQASANTVLTTASADLAIFSTECTAKDTAVATATTALSTANTTLLEKQTAYLEAQTAYAIAQQATATALSAIVALKPDYEPEVP